jgi:hypothetical protein
MGEGDVLATVGEASRLLMLAPQLDGDVDGLCHEHLSSGAPVLQVSLRTNATAVVDSWDEHDGAQPAALSVVAVGPIEGEAVPDSVTVRRASNPGDLTGLGIAITRCLDEFDAPPVVCFDSLTVLLQYVETGAAFRFLHTMSRYFANADARVHAHLDPDAVSDRAVNSISSLFDAIVAHESAGDVPGLTLEGGTGGGAWRTQRGGA